MADILSWSQHVNWFFFFQYTQQQQQQGATFDPNTMNKAVDMQQQIRKEHNTRWEEKLPYWPLGPGRHGSGFNPLRAKFFKRNTNIYLHFVSFLHIDTTQVFEILPQIRQKPTFST